MKTRTLSFALLLLLAVAAVAGARGIRPWTEDPRYWEYDGEPVLLLGGSPDDDLFQYPEFEAWLDTLAGCGGNVIRNTMASSDSTRPWPFARLADGRYDLERFDPEYWDRFSRLLRAAHERDIVVQIEVWATFCYYREQWTGFNPFNPSLNINYTVEGSGLPGANQSHPTAADNPFFRTVPALEKNRTVLEYQEKFVDKLLSYSLEYDNILYAMDNETSVAAEWGEYWANFITARASERGKKVYVTEMWDPWDLRHEWHLRTIDHPETYSFIDISQNNWQQGQRHQDALAYVRDRISDNPRPVNNTKVYSKRAGESWCNPRVGVGRFWGNVWGGCASTRFHRPTDRGHGIGIDHNARRAIRGIRMVMEHFDLFRSRVRDDHLTDRSENEAYCLAVDGESWAVMFPDGGRVLLETEGVPEGASFEVRWFDAEYLDWKPAETMKASPYLPLGAPGEGRWVALVRAVK